MRKTTLLLSLMGLLLSPALASGQAVVELRVGLPVVLPQLVVVSPGIMVVPDVDEEVFFTSGFYWVHRGDLWYRSPNHRHGWVVVPGRVVPPGLTRMPPGHYKRWKPGRPGPGPAYRGGPVYRGGPPPAPVRGGGPVYRGGNGPGRHHDEGRHEGHDDDHGGKKHKGGRGKH